MGRLLIVRVRVPPVWMIDRSMKTIFILFHLLFHSHIHPLSIINYQLSTIPYLQYYQWKITRRSSSRSDFLNRSCLIHSARSSRADLR